jgi:DNA processing protein
MPTASAFAMDVLRLTLLPGVGPILIGRLLKTFGSADAVWHASRADLERIPGIGANKSAQIVSGRTKADELARAEVSLATSLGVRIIAREEARYPTLLGTLPDAPPLLYVKGTLDAEGADRFGVALVGSRRCSSYGLTQAARFAGVLAQAGLTVVSGGARGIDSAAHRGALRAGGRTIAVVGCGLAQCYPPENAELFDEIAKRGAVVSELPLQTGPMAENFPARNRLISGLSLGVLVIEANERSGALITARLAGEDHGREVMALPGRVDSSHSAGCLHLLKSGGATLVTDPGDVIHAVEQAGFHQHHGTHTSRYVPRAPVPPPDDAANNPMPEPKGDAGADAPKDGPRTTPHDAPPDDPPAPGASTLFGQSDLAARVLEFVIRGAPAVTIEEIAQRTGLDLAQVRATVTLLEIQRRVTREGTRIRRA